MLFVNEFSILPHLLARFPGISVVLNVSIDVYFRVPVAFAVALACVVHSVQHFCIVFKCSIHVVVSRSCAYYAPVYLYLTLPNSVSDIFYTLRP